MAIEIIQDVLSEMFSIREQFAEVEKIFLSYGGLANQEQDPTEPGLPVISWT
jgi:hypothetical protein